MKIKYKYKLNIDRHILRDYLDNLTLFELADILSNFENERGIAERMLSDYIARSIEITDVRYILAVKLGFIKIED